MINVKGYLFRFVVALSFGAFPKFSRSGLSRTRSPAGSFVPGTSPKSLGLKYLRRTDKASLQ